MSDTIRLDTVCTKVVELVDAPCDTENTFVCGVDFYVGCLLTYHFLCSHGGYYTVYDNNNNIITEYTKSAESNGSVIGGGFTVENHCAKVVFGPTVCVSKTVTSTVEEIIRSVSSLEELCNTLSTFNFDDSDEQQIINLYLEIHSGGGGGSSSISHRWDGTVLYVTSDSGTSSADLQGPQGIQGPAGKTPEKGTDYWTKEDKEEISKDMKDLLDSKVDKEDGKGLSTNDYTDEDQALLLDLVDLPNFVQYLVAGMSSLLGSYVFIGSVGQIEEIAEYLLANVDEFKTPVFNYLGEEITIYQPTAMSGKYNVTLIDSMYDWSEGKANFDIPQSEAILFKEGQFVRLYMDDGTNFGDNVYKVTFGFNDYMNEYTARVFLKKTASFSAVVESVMTIPQVTIRKGDNVAIVTVAGQPFYEVLSHDYGQELKVINADIDEVNKKADSKRDIKDTECIVGTHNDLASNLDTNAAVPNNIKDQSKTWKVLITDANSVTTRSYTEPLMTREISFYVGIDGTIEIAVEQEYARYFQVGMFCDIVTFDDNFIQPFIESVNYADDGYAEIKLKASDMYSHLFDAYHTRSSLVAYYEMTINSGDYLRFNGVGFDIISCGNFDLSMYATTTDVNEKLGYQVRTGTQATKLVKGINIGAGYAGTLEYDVTEYSTQSSFSSDGMYHITDSILPMEFSSATNQLDEYDVDTDKTFFGAYLYVTTIDGQTIKYAIDSYDGLGSIAWTQVNSHVDTSGYISSFYIQSLKLTISVNSDSEAIFSDGNGNIKELVSKGELVSKIGDISEALNELITLQELYINGGVSE